MNKKQKYIRTCENCGIEYSVTKSDIKVKNIKCEHQTGEARNSNGWIEAVYEDHIESRRYFKCPVCDYEDVIE